MIAQDQFEAEQGQLELFKRRFPKKPFCKDEKEDIQLVRPLSSAMRRRYIQANPPALRLWMLFDVDRAGGAMAWDDAHLPEPAWVAMTPHNSHAHLSWGIEAPVLLDDPERQKPLRYLTAIERAYAAALEADPSYAGHLTKNPTHSDWRTLWGKRWLYSLDELAEYVDLNKYKARVARQEEVGLGRNCELFEWLRKWAYREVRGYKAAGGKGVYVWWEKACRDAALQRNGDFRVPLPLPEVSHTAKSVARWTWRNFSLEGFSRVQSARGKRSGEVRRQGSEAEQRPWEALGISRRTYYYRKRKGQL